MRTRLLVYVLCITASLISFGHAETVFSKSYQYFRISGSTAADLDAELSRRGPKASGSELRHPGATQMKFSGSYKYQELRNGRCKVRSANIKLHTKLILPRWSNRGGATQDVALIWDTLSRDIKRHEERHAEIARQYARKLEKSLIALYPRKSCDEMEAIANKESEKILAQHDKAQQNFDRTESASFDRRMNRMLRFKIQKMNEK